MSSDEPSASEARLQADNQKLREQVRALFQSDAKLHQAKAELAHQVRIFGRLHDLSLGLTVGASLREIAARLATFATRELRYERSLVLLDPEASGIFSIAAFEGYAPEQWSERLAAIRLPAHDAPIGRLGNAEKVACSEERPDEKLCVVAAELGLSELQAYAMRGSGPAMIGVLIAGSSPEGRGSYVSIDNEISAAGLANLSALGAAAFRDALSHLALSEERNLLEVRVASRTRELNDALIDLASLDQAKSRFFANVSHELRTPLTLSIAPLEEIMSGHLEPQLSRSLEVVYRNQLRLLELINELLDFAKIDAGKMTGKFEPIDLVGAIHVFASNLRSAAETRALELVVDAPAETVEVYVDPDKLEKIVMNLLSNAFKFTPDKGRIRIGVRAHEDRVELAVSDTGVGIEQEALGSIFQRFVQVERAQDRRYQGTGIGLALVKELVELHGGTIAVESAPGIGTTFTVAFQRGKAHLPAGSVADSRSARSGSSSSLLAGFDARALESITEDVQPPADPDAPIVLVVDDVAEMRALISRILSGRYHIHLARDGREALELARDIKPSVIVSDVMMPNMDGFQLCAAIKSDPGAISRTPVILLSARGELSKKLEGLSQGADDYLAKPFHAEELRSRVDNLIKLRAQEDRLQKAELKLVEAERRAFEHELVLARRVQDSILPVESELQLSGVRVAGRLISASVCSGDFWTVRELGDGRILVLVADVTGHGAQAAMVAQLAIGGLHAILRTSDAITPSQVLSGLSAVLLESSSIWMTAVACIVDAHKRTCDWSNAGHPPIWVHRPHEAPRPIVEKPNSPLGAKSNQVFEESHISIDGGCRILIHSDGVTDAKNRNNQIFGTRQLGGLFARSSGSPASTIDLIEAELHRFMGEERLKDDVTVVVIASDASSKAALPIVAPTLHL